MRPWPLPFITRNAARLHRKADVRLVSSTRSHSSSGSNARVVDQQVHGTEALDGLIEQVVHRGFVRNIGAHGERLRPAALEPFDQSREPLDPAGRQHHMSAFLGEGHRAGLADAGTRPGDDRDAAFDNAHPGCSLLLIRPG
jgi:hypothetical protein